MAEETHWYLRVKTLNDQHLVDVGPSGSKGKAELERAKQQMQETGAVTIAGGLVLNASDIVSISLHDGKTLNEAR